MKSYTVKDVMVPLDEYATVSAEATLMEAVEALEKAQMAFNQERYKHRAVLVMDSGRKVIGKLSQHDFLQALEPNYQKMEKEWKASLSRFGFGSLYIKNALKEFDLWQTPLQNLCDRATGVRVKDVMYTPGEGEFVNAEATLDEAVHRLISGRHHSLLATHGGEIVGVLRLTDVFEMVNREMKECV